MNATTHPIAPEEVMAFVDGELSAAEAPAVSTHLEHCAECSTLAEQFRGTSQSLSQWKVPPVSAKLENSAINLSAKMRSGHAIFWTWKQWTAGLGAAVGVLLLFFAVATPNLLRSRMAANASSAVGSLRSLNTAAVTYFGSYGHYPAKLENFGSSPSGVANEYGAGLVDDVLAKGGPKSGYLFTYRMVPAIGFNARGGYTINADPIEPGREGQRHFSTNQTGTIFVNGVELEGPSLPGRSEAPGQGRSTDGDTAAQPAMTLPMISRNAQLELAVTKLDDARQSMDRILTEHKGYIAQLSATAESGSARVLFASVRVPVNQLDVCLGELKKLGRVTQESQTGEEVTQQHVDLDARLKNSHNTEARLNNVLKQRSGQVKDVLEVEKESARVRGEIEKMEAEQKNLEHRVDFATISLQLTEEYKAQLNPPAASVSTRIHNAFVAGYRDASDTLLGFVLFFAESGPTLLIWLLVLLVPAWLLRRRYRRSLAAA